MARKYDGSYNVIIYDKLIFMNYTTDGIWKYEEINSRVFNFMEQVLVNSCCIYFH